MKKNKKKSKVKSKKKSSCLIHSFPPHHRKAAAALVTTAVGSTAATEGEGAKQQKLYLLYRLADIAFFRLFCSSIFVFPVVKPYDANGSPKLTRPASNGTGVCYYTNSWCFSSVVCWDESS